MHITLLMYGKHSLILAITTFIIILLKNLHRILLKLQVFPEKPPLSIGVGITNEQSKKYHCQR